jgi:catechol 2,3-dioxygenase-like lactoylglutathione lyase family enzyme
MTVQLNHTIVWCSDQERSSGFFATILGRPTPTRFGPFHVGQLDNGVSLDFYQQAGEIAMQHYAFLIGEDDFDGVFERIKERDMKYWADPGREREGEIYHHNGGRGFYFLDPDGHLLEVLTRPYASDE